MPYIIGDGCVGEKNQECVSVCPVDCIFDAGEKMAINPEECIDCGLCEVACPVQAIRKIES